jgi:ATP-dependent exoDNAse (exonuclease V) alpha subunit
MDELRTRMLDDLIGEKGITLSDDQAQALDSFLAFEKSQDTRSTYLLTGSAGTGKTFLIEIFRRYFNKLGYKVILLAPTGRAAKVISRRTQRNAYTIHHHIYSPFEGSLGEVAFQLKENKAESKTVYVVDEASMIGDQSGGGSMRGMLADLLQYVFGNDESRKLILVGDPVQLPPVGHQTSPALDPEQLAFKAFLSVFFAELTHVKRQELDSGVLSNAVGLRDAFVNQRPDTFHLEPTRDVLLLENAWDSVETYLGYYQPGNLERVIFITYSNGLASRVNQGIRHELHQTEEMITAGELLMVVKNNYTWGDPKRMPFIANGEMGTVQEVFPETYEEKYGMKWMDGLIEFQDAKGEFMPVECKIVLDLLQAKQPQLDRSTMATVLHERQKAYMGLSPHQAQEQLRTDPYVNALQVKYGYCVTGHKAQGGQWENVIVGFEPDYGQDSLAYLRWAYTVLTRAEERLFLLNCPFVEQ